MPRFEFQGFDSVGKRHEGDLDAETAEAAVRLLAARGLRIQKIQAQVLGRSAETPPIATRQGLTMERLAPARGHQYSVRMRMPSGEIGSTSVTVGNATLAIYDVSEKRFWVEDVIDAGTQKSVLSKSGRERSGELSFMFTQIADLLRAGIAPAQAFRELSTSLPYPKLRQVCGAVAEGAERGERVSDNLALFPNQIPPGAIGLIRASEVGGFLPQACVIVADHAMRMHKNQRFFLWIWAVVALSLPLIPLSFFFRTFVLQTWDAIDKSGGNISTNDVFAEESRILWHAVLWPYGPGYLAFIALVFLLRSWLLSSRFLRFRHQLVARYPVINRRTRSECASRFSACLAHLSRGGASPQAAWWLAACSVPNVYVRDQFIRAGAAMNEGSRLSQLGTVGGLMPPEFPSVLATGELTGEVANGLERISELTDAEYRRHDTYMRFRFAATGFCFYLSLALLAICVICYVWYKELPDKVLSGFSTD